MGCQESRGRSESAKRLDRSRLYSPGRSSVAIEQARRRGFVRKYGKMRATELWLKDVEAWHDFYVVVGGAAAGLTGLMFVVVSLGPKVIATRGSAGVRGFVTPTVVYFATVLIVAALMTIPLLHPRPLAAILAVGGIGCAISLLSAGAHLQWRKSKLGVGDWLWYIGLPILSYLLILTSAGQIWRGGRFALDTLAAAAILFLIIGIRNAWDLVLWMAQETGREEKT